MIKISPFLFTLITCAVSMVSCAQQKVVHQPVMADAPAFPGAEGFGRYATGGRGGKVVVVTNLNDDGEGSLRDALKTKGPKIIVFGVSGTIHLLSKLNITANTTLAGQSAPGGGICLADHPVSIAGNNVILRYLRFRLGDRYQNTGMVDGAGADDALSSSGRTHIMIDHCSISWSTDEAFSVYNGDSVTLQWNLIAEPLNYSYHFEKGDTDFEHHGYGGIWGGRHMSAHHNLLAHCVSRTPRFNGIRHQQEELVDFRNNVIYNWGHNNVYGGEGGRYNLVNNYYRPGPATSKKVSARILNPMKLEKPAIPFGSYHVSGNFVEGSKEVTSNNWLGVHLDKGTEADKETVKSITAFASEKINTQSAADAYQSLLKTVGASLPLRDTLDERILNDVRNGTGRIIDVQGGHPHGTKYEATVHAWPALANGVPAKDSDHDGMPDDWEKLHGLDPENAADAALVKAGQQYANIEIYLNSLIR